MMRLISIVFFMLCILSSCISIDYLGKYCPSTKSVEVFLTENDINRPYETIGRMEVVMGEHSNSETYVLEMRLKACQVGGNGLILHQPTTRTRSVRTSSRGDEKSRFDQGKSHSRTKQKSETRIIRKKILTATVIRFKNVPGSTSNNLLQSQ